MCERRMNSHIFLGILKFRDLFFGVAFVKGVGCCVCVCGVVVCDESYVLMVVVWVTARATASQVVM